MILDAVELRSPLVGHIEPTAPENLEGDLIQPGHPLFGVIWINKKRVSGAPCFYRSRVPIVTLLSVLRGRGDLDEFHEDFPGVTEEQVHAVLDLAFKGLLEDLPKP